jgi:hypothetical protein
MRRRRNDTRTHVVAGTRGQGAISLERITNWQTALGIGMFALLAVIARFFVWLIFFALCLIVGRQAGGLMALSLAVYIYLGLRMGRDVSYNRMIPLALMLSLPLIVLDLFDYWLVDVLDWAWIDLRLYYSWRGAEFVPAPPILVAVRIFSVVVVPTIVWAPAGAADWALLQEVKWPKVRETIFAPADPGSITPPPGEPALRIAHPRGEQEEPTKPESRVVPAPIVVGK